MTAEEMRLSKLQTDDLQHLMQTCEDLSFLKTSSLLCSFLLMHPGWMVCRPLATSGCLRRLIVLKHFKPTWGRSVLSTFALKPEGSLFQDVSEDLPPTLKWFWWCSRFSQSLKPEADSSLLLRLLTFLCLFFMSCAGRPLTVCWLPQSDEKPQMFHCGRGNVTFLLCQNTFPHLVKQFLFFS